MFEKSMLIDTSKCMACRACQVACKQWNQLPAEETKFEGTYENPLELSYDTWTKVGFKEEKVNDEIKWFFSKQGCMHCGDAACLEVCPADGIYRTDHGSVNIDLDKCINCGECVKACLFQVIGFKNDELPFKCTFCVERVEKGIKPACASVCPSGAVLFGDRDELIYDAEARVDELKQAGVDARVYGIDEFGGKGMGRVYVLEGSPECYGFELNPSVAMTTKIWSKVMKPVKIMVAGLAAVGVLANRAESMELKDKSKT